MRESVLPLLCCPACQGDLILDVADRATDGHVLTGTLACRRCDTLFAISGGVPRLVPGTVRTDSTHTAARFGAQWKTFDHMSEYQESWLMRWLDPFGPTDFRDKVVLEAGCGKGRHTVVCASWGAKDILALDLGEAVDVAFEHTRALPNVHIVQGDILHPPTRRAFDLAFSVGVLHHLPDPHAGFVSLVGKVKAGGKLAIWVYGYESNEWIVRYVNPLREKVTARLPPRLLYWLSLPPSAALACALPLYRHPRVSEKLPYRDYLSAISALPLREVHNIVFDQLVTPIAYYLPESEVRRWFATPGFTDVKIAWHNKNSWRGSATVG